MDKAAFIAELKAHRVNHIAFLQRFLQAPSPNPPGDTREATNVIIGYLLDHGITPNIVAPQEDMPNVVHDFVGENEGLGTMEASSRLVFNGHIDVFPSGPESDWTPGRGPWSGYIDGNENRIYGRGTCDMKCGTAALIIAYAYLYKHRGELYGSLGLAATSDEETGSRWGAKYLLDDSLGGGFGDRWKGNVMLNAEPSSLKSIRFAEKGTLRLTFTVETEGAHGAYLHRSASATIVAAKMIPKLEELIDSIVPDIDPALQEYMSQPSVISAIEDSIGPGASKISLKPTLNIGTLNGGLKVNMIPSLCTFEADIRLPIGLTAATVLDQIDSTLLPQFTTLPGVHVTLSVQQSASNDPAPASSYDHPIVFMMAKTAQEFSGKGGVEPVAIPSLGASDCKFWRKAGVPTYHVGVSPGLMGAKNESADLDEFMGVLITHAGTAWEYLGGK